MKRLSLILIVLSLALAQRVHAQYYSVNYDGRQDRGPLRRHCLPGV